MHPARGDISQIMCATSVRECQWLGEMHDINFTNDSNQIVHKHVMHADHGPSSSKTGESRELLPQPNVLQLLLYLE